MRVLRVFEHQTVPVRESASGTSLTPTEFEALARLNDANEARFFTLGHRCITFSEHVGVVQVGALTVEILPKSDQLPPKAGDGARWQSVLLTMLRAVWGLPLFDVGPASQRVGANALLELIIGRFVGEVEVLLHQGLARGYREHEENQPALRGRILHSQHLRENLVRADRFFVRYAVFDHDTPHNRVLSAALRAALDVPLPAALRARVEALHFRLPELPSTGIPARVFDRLTWSRSTERYRTATGLARLILERHAPALHSGAVPVLALLFDMNQLWESFVALLFERALQGQRRYSARAQASRAFWRTSAGGDRCVRPDILVRDGPQTALVVDTKWKVPKKGPSMDDLRQVFVYNELFGSRRGALVYPVLPGSAQRVAGIFQADPPHTCELVGLDVTAIGEGREAFAAVVRDVAALVDPALLRPPASG